MHNATVRNCPESSPKRCQKCEAPLQAVTANSRPNQISESFTNEGTMTEVQDKPLLRADTSETLSALSFLKYGPRGRRHTLFLLFVMGLLCLIVCVLLAAIIFLSVRGNQAAFQEHEGVYPAPSNETHTFAHVVTRLTPLFPLAIEENASFRMAQEEIVRRVNTARGTWQARLNVYASPRISNKPKTNHRDIWTNFWADIKFLNWTKHRRREAVVADLSTLPESFDARIQWPFCATIHDVWDQAGCGSCWAVAVASTMADRICIQSNGTEQPRLSVEDIVQCCPTCRGCKGAATLLEPWQFYLQHGMSTGGMYGSGEGCKPYSFPPGCGKPCSPESYIYASTSLKLKCDIHCAADYDKTYENDKYYAQEYYWLQGHSNFMNILNQVSSYLEERSLEYILGQIMPTYHHLLRKIDGIQKSGKIEAPIFPPTIQNNTLIEQMIRYDIYKRGPVSSCFKMTEDFQHYDKGIYEATAGEKMYGHCVRIIGWGVKDGIDYWLIANSWGRDWGETGMFRMRRGTNESGIENDVFAGIPKPRQC